MVTVLIVDDSKWMRMQIKRALEKLGCIVIGTAENGAEGVKKYKILNPTLVIMDITMPVMNGLVALKKIKEYDQKANVIICSSLNQDPMLAETQSLGAKVWLTKPFVEKELHTIIKKNFKDQLIIPY